MSYIDRDNFRMNIQCILNDETCPLHIAAAIEQYLDNEPEADAAPIVYGHWICTYNFEEGTTEVVCSNCKDSRDVPGCYVSTDGESTYYEDFYCPHCGARMDYLKWKMDCLKWK